MNKSSERRYIMHKDFTPPVSIEEFAAYLDGNLSDNDMKRVSTVIENNEAMHNIVLNSQSVDESLSDYEPLELVLPDGLASLDFDIPQFDNGIDIPNNWDGLEVAECAPDVVYNDASISGDDSSIMISQSDDVLHHTEYSDNVTNDINNEDFTQEHNAFENSITETNE